MVDAKSPIQRIDELSALARTAWFSLLGVLAFIAVTLLSVTHANVLLDSRMIELPIVKVSVPTKLFLYLAPVVVLALYINLHLYLGKLWRAFQVAPDDDGARAMAMKRSEAGASGMIRLKDGSEVDPLDLSLADCIQPWLVNDFALQLKQGTRPRDHHRILPRVALSLLTVWIAAPAVVVFLWLKALLARDLLLSGVILVCLTVIVCVGIASLLEALCLIRHKGTAPEVRRFARIKGVAFVLTAVTGLSAYGLTHPEVERLGLPTLRQALNLDNQQVAALPASWEGATAAREEFRSTWCNLRSVPGELCATLPGESDAETRALLRARVAYCATDEKKRPGRPGCALRFEKLDRQFDGDWVTVRQDSLRQVQRTDLAETKLMHMHARDANFTAANFDGANLTGVEIERSILEGAQFIGARLDGIRAFYADLRFANLTEASLRPGPDRDTGRIEGVNLVGARLEGAVLYGALLPRARLAGAHLAAADLREADLTGAILQGAQLHRAQLDGTILIGADLTGVTGLTQAQLNGAVIDGSTRLPVLPPKQAVKGPTCLLEEPEKLVKGPNVTADDVARIRRLVCTGQRQWIAGGPDIVAAVQP